MKKILIFAVMLAVCLLACPAAAATGSPATLSVRAVCDNGDSLGTSVLSNGDTFSVQIALENYSELVGNGTVGSDFTQTQLERVIANLILTLNYDTSAVAPVKQGGEVAWDSPIGDVVTNGSLLTAELADGLRFIMQTDQTGGKDAFIDAADLAASDGVILTMQFKVIAHTESVASSTCYITPTFGEGGGLTVNSKAVGSDTVSSDTYDSLALARANVVLGQGQPDVLRGDCNGDNAVTSADANYLLYHIFFGERYPVNQTCDFNGDNAVTSADANYLLYHVFFGDRYPLS